MVLRAYGGAEGLQLEDLPTPVPGPGQILVRVATASVNPVDLKMASGEFRPILRAHFPHVPGFDAAGEVAAVGTGITGFAVGDRVHARNLVTGSCAEYVLTTPNVTVPMPTGMDFATAAGIPLAGMTALQGLRDQGGMPMQGATQRVLVIGASGGVGHLAVQIAHAAGAHVIGICSARNRAFVLGLGADEVIDYQAPNPYANLAPCDIILDCVGESHSTWLPRLTKNGCFASMVPGPALFLRSMLNPLRGQKVRPVLLKANAADLRILDELASAGRLRLVIDHRYPLAELARAWERSKSGRAVGKIIVDVTA